MLCLRRSSKRCRGWLVLDRALSKVECNLPLEAEKHEKDPPLNVSRLGCLGTGALSGGVGAIIGVGGGVIAVPFLKLMGLPQRMASATCLPMVIFSAGVAAVTWNLNTPDGMGPDVMGAVILGSVAALSSPIGVRLSIVLDGKYISRALGVFMLGMGSFMAWTLAQAYFEKKDGDEEIDTIRADPIPLTGSPRAIGSCVALGVLVGLAGGAFGVGGGVILVPILTKLTGDVQTATATSLAAIIPPTLVSTLVCARNGMILWPLTPALILGASVASFIMAKFTAEMLTRPQQKGAFVGTMAVLGTRMVFVRS